jgi:spermidine synthase
MTDRKEYMRLYYLKNKDKFQENNKKYFQENKDEIMEKRIIQKIEIIKSYNFKKKVMKDQMYLLH